MVLGALRGLAFDWWIAAYFTMAALAAGLILRGVAALFSGDGHRSLRSACGWSLVLVGLGSVCLIADLSSPRDFLLTMTNFNPESWIAWGSRILALFGMLAGISLVFLPGASDESAPRPVFVPLLLAVAALGMSLYPAMVLRQVADGPLWSHLSLPLLFIVSALHVGWSLAPHAIGAKHCVAALPLTLTEAGLLVWLAVDEGPALLHFPGAWIFVVTYAVTGLLLPLARRKSLWTGLAVVLATFALRGWLVDAGQPEHSLLRFS